MFLKLAKNFILVLLLAALIFNGALFRPKIALAVAPVIDVDAIGQLTTMNITLGLIEASTAATAASTAEDAVANTTLTTKTIAQWAAEIAGQVLKKQLLDKIVQAIIDWIKGGYQGEIIGDWGEFMKNAGRDALDQFVGNALEDSDLSFLCSPFNFQVRLTLLPVEDFSEDDVGCTLTTIEGNIDKFFEDFSNGSWLSYQEHFEPQNNFYGAVILSWDEANQRQAKNQEAAQNEGTSGGGFLSSKNCDADGKNCTIVTPGRTVGKAVETALIDTPINSLIGASDVAAYISAIIDTAINQLTTSAIDAITGTTNTYKH